MADRTALAAAKVRASFQKAWRDVILPSSSSSWRSLKAVLARHDLLRKLDPRPRGATTSLGHGVGANLLGGFPAAKQAIIEKLGLQALLRDGRMVARLRFSPLREPDRRYTVQELLQGKHVRVAFRQTRVLQLVPDFVD